MSKLIFFLCLVALISSHFAFASLEDFCVADFKSSVKFSGGLPCKNPMQVQANDFHFNGKSVVVPIPSNSSAQFLISFRVSVEVIPGLNTLGISMSRIFYGVGGFNPPHIHPRASEMFTVTEGSLLVGLVTTNPENRLFTKVLQKGDVFVFPAGLVHFQQSVGSEYAAAWSAFNSVNPGTITIAKAAFGSNPTIADEVLAKAFQVDKKIVHLLKSKF